MPTHWTGCPLPFDHTDRPHTGDLVRKPRAMHNFDHVIDVLVGLWLFLCQTLVALGACNDAAGFEFLVNAPAGCLPDSSRPPHGAACPMTRRSKGLIHAPLLTDKHPTGPAHVAGNDHGLADLAIAAGNLRMVRRKGAGGAFAVD